jgi:SAM-dependent methyltransferase
LHLERRVAKGESASTPEFWAANFRASSPLRPRDVRLLLKDPLYKIILRELKPGSRILDAGCGMGQWVAFLRREGYHAEGLDYSPELIGRLREAYPDQTWHPGDIRSMPFANGVFDGIISWGVIEHDPKGPEAALAEFRRIVRPGGMLLVTVPLDCERQRLASKLQFPGVPDGKFFQFFFTPDELADRVTKSGFRVMEAAPVPIAHPALLFPRSYARIGGTPLGWKVVKLASMIVPASAGYSMTYCLAR